MLKSYFKIAFRNLVRNRVYSGINIAGLSIGLACCMCIGLYVADELSYDRFNAHFDDIYRIIEKQKQADGMHTVAVTPGPLAASLKKDFQEVIETTRVGSWSGILANGRNVAEAENMIIADSTLFDIFTFPLVMGNADNVLRGTNEVVISETMAEKLFGSNWSKTAIIGRSLLFNNQQEMTLTGVAKNPPLNSHLQFDVMLPFRYLVSTDPWSEKWNSNNFHTYIRLRPETNLVSFSDKIRFQLKRYTGQNDATLDLQPLGDIYLKSHFDFKTDWGKRSDILYVRIFLTVAGIILFIGIVNFINLATARASKRALEVGVRKTVGAKRSGLILQFLSESFLMTIIAVSGALLLTQSFVPIFKTVADKDLVLPLQSVIFWSVLAGLTLAVGLLTGLYPAVFLSSFRPAKVLKGVFDVKSGRIFRQSLVIGQFAISIMLAIATFVIYQQMSFIQNKKLGFDQSQLMYIRLKGDLKVKSTLFKQEIQRLSGVEMASAATSNMVDVMNSTNIEWEGQTPKGEFLITQMNIDDDFLETMGMSLVSGRNFSNQISSDTAGNYMINETAAKRMGWTTENALGKTVKFWGTSGKIVGVFKDFHFRALHISIEPFIFRYKPKEFYFNLLVKTKPSHLQQTIADISEIYKKYDVNYPLSYGFIDQDVRTLYRSEQRTGQIVLYFSVLTILVSCLGLFGLTTFTTEQRFKEIGIRKVMGASVSSIVTLLSKDFMKLILISIIIASPIAWYASNKWLQNFAYKIDIQYWTFAVIAVLFLSISLITMSFQSVKAALTNPVKSLRSE